MVGNHWCYSPVDPDVIDSDQEGNKQNNEGEEGYHCKKGRFDLVYWKQVHRLHRKGDMPEILDDIEDAHHTSNDSQHGFQVFLGYEFLCL